jgi:phosphoglycolate phosphatase
MGKSCMGNRNLAIFDFDGTIADSAAWFGDALNELARHNGFREVSAEQREIAPRLFQQRNLRLSRHSLLEIAARRPAAARDRGT